MPKRRRVTKKKWTRGLKQKAGGPRTRRQQFTRVANHALSAGLNIAKHGIRYAIKRRFNGGEVSQQKRRKATTDGGFSTGEVSYTSRHHGRPMRHSLKNAWKAIQATTMPVHYRLQGTLPFSSAQGFYKMDRTVTGTTPLAASTQAMPLYIYELNPVPFNGASGTYIPAWRLRADYQGAGANPKYNWVTAADTNPDGTTGTANWEVENSERALAVDGSVRPGAMDIMSYVDIRMICVGATDTPTKYEISLVQFSKDWMHPGFDVTQSINTGNVPDGNADRVWEQEVWPFITSPIMPRAPVVSGNYFKKLHTISFTLQAKTTIEKSNEGHFKIVKLFKWLNRRQRYDWGKRIMNPLPAAGGVVGQGYTENNGDTGGGGLFQLSQTVEPRARIYLMVKATSQDGGVSDTGAKTPSFDVVIRKKHIMDG